MEIISNTFKQISKYHRQLIKSSPNMDSGVVFIVYNTNFCRCARRDMNPVYMRRWLQAPIWKHHRVDNLF